ncbi:MAG: regulatory protein RecX [Chloroflexi bacterium]|nr:regulatory protein RecX [Chloroflexota bacterium]
MNDQPSHSHQRCLDTAYRYLAYRPRSEFELKTYLKRKGFTDIEAVMLELGKKGLLDDLAFAQFWTANRESFRPRSRVALRSELRAKGIAADIIDKVLMDTDEGTSAYNAAKSRAKRFAGEDYDSFRRRLGVFLKQRGFDYEVTRITIDHLWDERGKDAQGF